MGEHTPGPWNLVWWGNEQYPFPLSIIADKSGIWIARGGQVSSEANARLIAVAPDLLEKLQGLHAVVAIMFGHEPDATTPEIIRSPLGPHIKIGEIMRDVEVVIARATGAT